MPLEKRKKISRFLFFISHLCFFAGLKCKFAQNEQTALLAFVFAVFLAGISFWLPWAGHGQQKKPDLDDLRLRSDYKKSRPGLLERYAGSIPFEKRKRICRILLVSSLVSISSGLLLNLLAALYPPEVPLLRVPNTNVYCKCCWQEIAIVSAFVFGILGFGISVWLYFVKPTSQKSSQL